MENVKKDNEERLQKKKKRRYRMKIGSIT